LGGETIASQKRSGEPICCSGNQNIFNNKQRADTSSIKQSATSAHVMEREGERKKKIIIEVFISFIISLP